MAIKREQIGATVADVRDVMIEGPSGLLKISPKHNRPNIELSKSTVTRANSAIATAYSADEPDRLRGPAHDFIWTDGSSGVERSECLGSGNVRSANGQEPARDSHDDAAADKDLSRLDC
jgi:phage terminase large subunit-like protein